MSIPAYRLTQTRFVPTAFDGEGARLYGGRWNSIGTPMVYVAGTRSLATLEILVHIEDASALEGHYSIIPIEIPERLILQASVDELPKGWHSPEPLMETQHFGDIWVSEARSAVLKVPSAVTTEEWNYLLNPAHPEFSAITIGPAVLFRMDPRLF